MKEVTKENYQKIKEIAKECHIETVKVYEQETLLGTRIIFIISLEKESSSLSQIAFERGLIKLLGDFPEERIYTFTPEDIDANVKAYKISVEEGNSMISKAQTLEQYVKVTADTDTPLKTEEEEGTDVIKTNAVVAEFQRMMAECEAEFALDEKERGERRARLSGGIQEGAEKQRLIDQDGKLRSQLVEIQARYQQQVKGTPQKESKYPAELTRIAAEARESFSTQTSVSSVSEKAQLEQAVRFAMQKIKEYTKLISLLEKRLEGIVNGTHITFESQPPHKDLPPKLVPSFEDFQTMQGKKERGEPKGKRREGLRKSYSSILL